MSAAGVTRRSHSTGITGGTSVAEGMDFELFILSIVNSSRLSRPAFACVSPASSQCFEEIVHISFTVWATCTSFAAVQCLYVDGTCPLWTSSSISHGILTDHCLGTVRPSGRPDPPIAGDSVAPISGSGGVSCHLLSLLPRVRDPEAQGRE